MKKQYMNHFPLRKVVEDYRYVTGGQIQRHRQYERLECGHELLWHGFIPFAKRRRCEECGAEKR